MAASITSYRASWVLPVGAPALAGGYVTVVSQRVAAVGGQPEGKVIDLGDATIVPGFVNAHLHLDLSAAVLPAHAPTSFADWLHLVVAHRRSISAGAVEQAARAAVPSVAASGASLVGDIASAFDTSAAFAAAGIAAVVFREVIGQRAERYEPLWHAALEHVATNGRVPGAVAGISPHAPYSTAAEVYRRAGAFSTQAPVATHWLETEEEREFLEQGGGPLRDFLEELNALPDGWSPVGDPWKLLEGGNTRWILVHVNCIDDADIDRLERLRAAGRLAGVVYCPRTHEYFGRPPHPWKRLRQAGIAVALGTDSLASNPDLSVFNEARFLAARGNDPRELLEMITLTGANVLGDGTRGKIEAGRVADLTLLSSHGRGARPEDAILSPETEVLARMTNGCWSSRSRAFADRVPGDADDQ